MAALASDGVEQELYDNDADGGNEMDGDFDIECDGEDYLYEFSDGENALNFVNRADGAALFQFSGLTYEDLAARKRKAILEDDQREESGNKKQRQEEEDLDEMEEAMMNIGLRPRKRRRRSDEPWKRGRRKGSKKKCNPEITQYLGDATLHFADGNYEQAIPLLHEVIRLSPNLSEAYHLLGLIYESTNDRRKAFNFYFIAALFRRKDVSLWKQLLAWSIEQNDAASVRFCLSRAVLADPQDIGLKFDFALMYVELKDYLKAAEIYEQIVKVDSSNSIACKTAAKMYQKSGKIDRGINVLESYIKSHNFKVDEEILNLLLSLYICNNAHNEALQHIENAHLALRVGEKLPFCLRAKAVICHTYVGHMELAEELLECMKLDYSPDQQEFIAEVADSFFDMGQYHHALSTYLFMEFNTGDLGGNSYANAAQCYIYTSEKEKAIPMLYKALNKMESDIGTRLKLSSLLHDATRDEEAISLLSPPENSESLPVQSSSKIKPWWLDGKIKMELAKIYFNKGMMENFVETIFSPIRETLIIERMNQKVRPVKKLPKSVLVERAKLLDEQQANTVYHGFRPIASHTELAKASRAKRALENLAVLTEERKAAAAAAGLDWQSEDSEGEALVRMKQEPPLPELLKDSNNHQLILDLCKALLSFHKYWEALEIISSTLKVAHDVMGKDEKEELQSLGAKISYSTPDPKHGFNYVRHMVQQHPFSTASWNWYYKVISKIEERFSRHVKFLHRLRAARPDCVPPIIICGHQFTAISQHQAAARDYLEAYKLQPDSPLICLCVGTALMNIALGNRLQNKSQCIIQGLAFLYKYLRLCDGSQEALYNVARAYHHIGLVTLAAAYYELVLSSAEKDRPIPRLPYEDSNAGVDQIPGYCDLRREAAYNLHLIYKNSGATDLARLVLKDHCTL